MLLLGSKLRGTAVMGLQTGSKLAHTADPLIDPADLRIIAYELEGPLLTDHPTFLRIADIRESGPIGMIVDSSDEFISLDDVIKIKALYELGFSLVGMTVIDQTKHKLGKIEDYSIDADSFVIQQLHVKRGIIKSLTDTSLLIHRSQIVEINDKNIIVHTTAKRVVPVLQSERRTFVNPFRTAAQPEHSDV